MQSIGIICEYSPFHNGHLYHINKIKELYPDSTIVLVMSGNFTQRGDVSIIDKWKKCDIALKAGVDLVVELPFPFAVQSADFFSYGAITILEYLHVDKLIFGSECDNINDLYEIAKCQIENEDFEKLVKIYSKFGNNYPTALSLALKDLTGKTIATPNDLLGISYVKTILKNNYKIVAETIKRTSDYHDLSLDNSIVSASAIRNGLHNNADISKNVPDFVLPYLNNLHFIDDYFLFLKYKIITDNDLSKYNTVDEGLDKLLKEKIVNCNSMDELISQIKSKRYTYNKLSRMLIQILCGYTKELNKKFTSISYIRLLGFNNSGQKYLNSIKKSVDVPIISKINKNKDLMLDFEINTTKIYDIIGNDDLVRLEYNNKIKKPE